MSLSPEHRRLHRRLHAWLPGRRVEAMKTFARSSEPALIDALVTDFLSSKPRRRDHAAEALDAAFALFRRRKNRHEAFERRRDGATEVFRRRGLAIVPALLDALARDDRRARFVAALGLEALAPAEALAPLLAATREHIGDAVLAPDLLRALAAYDDPSATELLIWAAAKHSEAAIEALCRQRTPAAVAVLFELAETSRARSVAIIAAEALAEILDGDDALLHRILDSAEPRVRARALDHLGARDDPASTAILLSCVSDDDPFNRTKAAKLLVERGAPGAVAAISAAIVRPCYAWELHALADILAELGNPEAIPALREAISPRRGRSSPDSASVFAELVAAGLDGQAFVGLLDDARDERRERAAIRAVEQAIETLDRPA